VLREITVHRGYIKLWRKMMDNPLFEKPAYFTVWVKMLLLATHKPIASYFNGAKITLKPGQFISGRKKLSKITGVTESTVYRVLKRLEIEQQIEQVSSNASSLFTIVNWEDYQASEQQNEQQTNNKRTTNEQPTNTKQEVKEVKNEKNTTLRELSSPTIANNSDSENLSSIFNQIEVKPKVQRFIPPTPSEVNSYCKERKNGIDGEYFCDHYQSRGWKIGKNPMKDWKAAVRTWEKNQNNREAGYSNNQEYAGVDAPCYKNWKGNEY
jgi:hypothetical protein